MSRYLVNFGDSWAYGSETKEYPVRSVEQHYAQQLSDRTGRQLIDLSRPGTSISHLILQFQQFIQQYYQAGNDYLAVFFITAQERQLVFDSQGIPQELHPSHEWSKSYYRDIYTDQLGGFNLNTVLLALQRMSAHYQIDDRYLLGWQHPDLWPEVDRDRFYNRAQSTALELLGNNNIFDCGRNDNHNPNFIPDNGHPSAIGHTRIAWALHHWIYTGDHTVIM
jgi:hypothetical protein